MTQQQIKERLEYLRGELRGERISYGELAELQDLTKHIDPGDTELLEAAGVEHEHQWGPLEQSRLGRIWHRKCQVPGCRAVNALDDDQPEED